MTLGTLRLCSVVEVTHSPISCLTLASWESLPRAKEVRWETLRNEILWLHI
jgi:hypothetical protein